MVLLISWLYFRNPKNQFSTSLKSAGSCDLLLARLALDDERSLWTISITEPRRPDELERGDREPSLLLDVDVGSGASRPFAVVGRDSFWGDADLRDIGRRIQDGDNRSKVEGGSVDMTSSDIE
jgi:hypothetical protein